MVNVWNEFAVQKAFLHNKGQLIEDADIIIGTTAIINNIYGRTRSLGMRHHLRQVLRWRFLLTTGFQLCAGTTVGSRSLTSCLQKF